MILLHNNKHDYKQLAFLALCSLYIGIATTAMACPTGSAVTVQNTGLAVSTSTPFDPFSLTDIRQNITLAIRNASKTDCSAVSLAFTDPTTPNQLTNGNDILTFAITPEVDSVSLVNQSSGITVGNVPAGATVEVKVALVIPAATTTTAPGDYYNNNTRLILSDAEAGELDSTKMLAISTQVVTLLNINIGGAEYLPAALPAYTMEFGILKAGATRSVNIITRANVEHSLHISSENHGVMVGPVPDTKSHVDYIAAFDGSELNLNTEAVIPLGDKTAIGGTTKTLQATITNINTTRAGKYQDIITLTVTSGL